MTSSRGSGSHSTAISGTAEEAASTALRTAPRCKRTHVLERQRQFPVTGRESLKFSYDRGALIRFGGKFQSVQVAWQYSWTGGWLPKKMMRRKRDRHNCPKRRWRRNRNLDSCCLTGFLFLVWASGRATLKRAWGGDLGCRSNCSIRVSSMLAKPRVKKV